MHIWTICQYFKPEPGAPSARLSGLAKQWVKQGHNVSILTSVPNHPQGEYHPDYKKSKAVFTEEEDGYTIVRHKFFITPNSKFLKKTWSHISFAWKVYKAHKKIKFTQKPDIIMASSPSFFCVISAWRLSRIHKVPFVFEVRDLWPGIFRELGTIKNETVLKTIEKLEMFLYRKAGSVVTVTKGFAKNIADRGIDPKKLYVITNGVSDDEWQTATDPKKNGEVSRLQSEFQINNMTKVLLYIGTHGQSQALGQIIDAARMMMNNSETLFLFVGDGADKARIESLAKGMPNVQFIPSQQKEKVWAFYNLAYACFIPLKDIPGFATFIPSKMFEVMAAGTPIVAMLQGEAADILNQSQSSIVCPPEKPEILGRELQTLIENPAKAEQMGRQGRQFVSQNYLHSTLAKKYIMIFERTISQHK